MAMISKRLSKGEKVCLAMVAVGLAAMLCGVLYMMAIVMFASSDTAMSVWSLVALTAGFVLSAVGMKLERRVNARRIAVEAITKARGSSRA
ncbi:hypothetical protein HMPREF1487_09516 [Pseudomonas sp. HPB0071]|uniref:Uncharacterized protein n=1 Tax=Pseudomonas luteola TaxID=47886 RepID=A0A2X2BWF3_PSELU|nr:hypothetical protein HMPREF1487_09516 [Pseudomonas sp. HPB0071]SPZ00017.1 Uncharacterised protein [Pseudomonas luteola]